MSEEFDITKFPEILKKAKEYRDKGYSRADVATALTNEYKHEIREEDVEAADEWFEEHAEAGGNTADSREIDGVKTGSSKQPPLSPPPSSLPATSSPSTAQATAQPTTPTQPPSSSVPAASGVVGGESPPPTGGPPPTAQPTAQATPPLAVPPGVQRAPIAAIDHFIREGYVAQDALEEIMKHNYHGKAYRKKITQRLALYNARQPPFNDIPANVVPGESLAAGNVLPGSGDNPENSPISTTSPQHTRQEQESTSAASNLQDPFEAARNMPDAEALQSVKNSLRSLSSHLGAMALSADFGRSIRVEDVEKADEYLYWRKYGK